MFKTISSLMLAACGATYAATPEIESFNVSQNPETHIVDVSFSLSAKAVVTLDVLTNGVTVGADKYANFRDSAAPGGGSPIGKVTSAGPHLWRWRPSRTLPRMTLTNGVVSVQLRAWSLDAPPDYMVLDSASPSNATFYASAADLPEGGIKTPSDPTNSVEIAALKSDVYRTTKLVLRKIPAAGVKWRMGSPTSEADRNDNETPHYVTLTNDYYVSIYPMTERQFSNFVKSYSGYGMILPKCWEKYTAYRGDFSTGKYCWPENGHDVDPSSHFGVLRGKTGFRFDFLTEAEWEYACRAGSTGSWCDGSSNPFNVAWSENSFSSTTNAKEVGLKQPNAWGLYDMHGNVYEWVLDQYGAYGSDSVIAPEGATDNISERVARGGTCRRPYKYTRSAARYHYNGTQFSDTVNGSSWGVRISCPAALPDWLR